jgi:hypothetical protein
LAAALQLAGLLGKEAQVPAVVKMAVIEDTKALRATVAVVRDRFAGPHLDVAWVADRRQPSPCCVSWRGR